MALSAAEPIQTILKTCKWDIGVIVVQRTVCISILSKSILWEVAKCIFLGGSTFSVLFYVMHFAGLAFSHGKQVLLWADSLQAGLILLSIDRWDFNGIMTWQGQARGIWTISKKRAHIPQVASIFCLHCGRTKIIFLIGTKWTTEFQLKFLESQTIPYGHTSYKKPFCKMVSESL